MVVTFHEETRPIKLTSNRQCVHPPSTAAITAAGYAVDGKGWLVPADKKWSIQAVDEDDSSPLSSPPADLEWGRGGDGRDGRDGGDALANRDCDS